MIQHSQKIIRAKELRNNMPDAEKLLWWALNYNKLGVKFRRQRPIGPYYVDFICLEHKLILELDGEQHSDDKAVMYDNRRTDYLKSLGYKLIRIPNDYIYKNLPGVVSHLQLIIDGQIDAHQWFGDKYK